MNWKRATLQQILAAAKIELKRAIQRLSACQHRLYRRPVIRRTISARRSRTKVMPGDKSCEDGHGRSDARAVLSKDLFLAT